jgi:hypothetical protein
MHAVRRFQELGPNSRVHWPLTARLHASPNAIDLQNWQKPMVRFANVCPDVTSLLK